MNPSAAIFCLCMVAVYSAGDKLTKTKRDLIPFPRVGRGEISLNCQLLGPCKMKRQGLIPFPRVGRNRGDEDKTRDGEKGKKRDVSENRGGMWFGPRLGRLQKRNYFNDDGSWALFQVKGYPDMDEEQENFGPKLSIQSSEEIDQSSDYRL